MVMGFSSRDLGPLGGSDLTARRFGSLGRAVGGGAEDKKTAHSPAACDEGCQRTNLPTSHQQLLRPGYNHLPRYRNELRNTCPHFVDTDRHVQVRNFRGKTHLCQYSAARFSSPSPAPSTVRAKDTYSKTSPVTRPVTLPCICIRIRIRVRVHTPQHLLSACINPPNCKPNQTKPANSWRWRRDTGRDISVGTYISSFQLGHILSSCYHSINNQRLQVSKTTPRVTMYLSSPASTPTPPAPGPRPPSLTFHVAIRKVRRCIRPFTIYLPRKVPTQYLHNFLSVTFSPHLPPCSPTP
ncbi:uncharacterized protein LY79DRAFT_282980 [Colletotrichum navitas]|uniref:Uncharacterized protein n=1 Tax=Colletotrichum navitas TaxID=681940 RepID=A0AAD8Q8X7_9PEZI|nr:uncharacterized protein LY79DRAFT_282980 [Colletotrichum navitas]KAK1598178.1 hypothetical protein LY79DRAFT_282980 [Colletotrichum navitas]